MIEIKLTETSGIGLQVDSCFCFGISWKIRTYPKFSIPRWSMYSTEKELTGIGFALHLACFVISFIWNRYTAPIFSNSNLHETNKRFK